MTYSFPASLDALRKYLKSNGFEGDSVKTSRQAAFVAQQLLGTRIKFPPQGSDMLPTLLSIQKEVPAKTAVMDETPRTAVTRSAAKRPKPAKPTSGRGKGNVVVCDFSTGIHIFCDGAAVPNPGIGGWGVVIYRNGVEIDSTHGGDPEATNNQMELTAILNAIERAAKVLQENPDAAVTIWCDSQYCVKGCNEWMPGWKAKGWQRGGDNAQPKNRILLNADLWKAIDEARGDVSTSARISIKWVKGHAEVVGNERADDLAEQGRLEIEDRLQSEDELESRYRQIMGAL